VYPPESDWEEECDDCACDDERGSVRRKNVAKSLNYLKHVANIDINGTNGSEGAISIAFERNFALYGFFAILYMLYNLAENICKCAIKFAYFK
jgi:hypothetical protein